MRYLTVVPSANDHFMLGPCLQSLKESEYNGDILMFEDGVFSEDRCKATCDRVGVDRIKFPDPALFPGFSRYIVEHYADDYDIVIFSHSDIYFSNGWFNKFASAWNELIEYNKTFCLNPHVTAISMPYPEYDTLDKYDIFRNDIVTSPITHHWMTGNHKYEVGWDQHGKEMQRTARYAPVFAFPMKWFRQLDFGKDAYDTYFDEVNQTLFSIDHRLWNMYVDTPYIYHNPGLGTGYIPDAEAIQKVQFKIHDVSYKRWMDTYEIHIECSLATWNSNILLRHYREIEDAFRTLDFNSIDYIFDEYYSSLGVCNRCPISACAYRGKHKDPNNWRHV